MRTHPRRQAAFTFVELLFAMAVLSIGMIGVAAAVYVGVDQTKSTLDETAAAAVARQAAAVMGRVLTLDNTSPNAASFFPASAMEPRKAGTPKLETLVPPLQISGVDHRFAWEALIRCASDAPTAELIIVVLRNQSGNDYSARDIAYFRNGTPDPVNKTNTPSLTARTMLLDWNNNRMRVSADDAKRLAGGAFVVLSGAGSGEYAGRILRVAGQDADGYWSFVPGQDLPEFTSAIDDLSGFVFGRGYADVTAPEKGYAGPSQAVAVYSTIVSLR